MQHLTALAVSARPLLAEPRIHTRMSEDFPGFVGFRSWVQYLSCSSLNQPRAGEAIFKLLAGFSCIAARQLPRHKLGAAKDSADGGG